MCETFHISDEKDIDIRLVDGQSDYSGIVEVYINGKWGSVCHDHWTNNDARVACRELGYENGKSRYSFVLNLIILALIWRKICITYHTSFLAGVCSCQKVWPITQYLNHIGTAKIGGTFSSLKKKKYWLDDVNCKGNETHLFACAHLGIGNHNCGQGKRAKVSCEGEASKSYTQSCGEIISFLLP